MSTETSVLFRNGNATVFLVDIPLSISLGQELSKKQLPRDASNYDASTRFQRTQKRLLSSAPIQAPYLLHTEPKTAESRARVLERIPSSEIVFQTEVVEPLVQNALQEIRALYQHNKGEWCLPRKLSFQDENFNDFGSRNHPKDSFRERKKKRRVARADDDKNNDGNKLPVKKKLFSCENRIVTPVKRELSSSFSGRGNQPPLILSPGVNQFESVLELCNIMVRNTSSENALIMTRFGFEDQSQDAHIAVQEEKGGEQEQEKEFQSVFNIPPAATFLLCRIPTSHHLPCADTHKHKQMKWPRPPSIEIIPGLPRDKKFNLILLDPPWSNRSVRRSGHYKTQSYLDDGILTQTIQDILRVHSIDSVDSTRLADHIDTRKVPHTTSACELSIAAIWITNSGKSRRIAQDALRDAGFPVCEEWVWIKTTVYGEPVVPVGSLWRKPYEVLVIGRKGDIPNKPGGVIRRVIAAVPDIHSRKPNLREIFEEVFFQKRPSWTRNEASGGGSGDGMSYHALEVFARNLTAGWWACGDEVLKFNSKEWWCV